MRLTKGSMLINKDSRRDKGANVVGILLYRKGCRWYFSLTSPHNETGEIVTTVQWATREAILRGINSGAVEYLPAKLRRKRSVQKR